jgi:hypothetical protein
MDGATRVEIEHAAHVITIVRRGDEWSDRRVVDLLDALGSLQVLTVIEEAPTNPAAYGFGADALRLRVLADTDVLAALEIGAMNKAETGVYVRRKGEPPVLLVGSLLRWELEKLRRVVSTTAEP